MTTEIRPSGYLAKVLGHDEQVLMIVHQHWLTVVGRIFLSLLFAVAVVAVVTAAQLYVPAQPYVSLGYVLALLAVPFVWWRIVVWRNHAYVLTSWRIIQMSGVFNKEVVDSLLEKVNDVKTEQSFLGRVFGYGDIEILTASEQGANRFRTIARPLELKVAMLDAKETLEHGRAAPAAAAPSLPT
jgi:uncharacterized membrane protein YdbT with pleckstrin-like domain